MFGHFRRGVHRDKVRAADRHPRLRRLFDEAHPSMGCPPGVVVERTRLE
jgi:hypothetical protein